MNANLRFPQDAAYSGPPAPANPFLMDWGDGGDGQLKASKVDSTQYASPNPSPAPPQWRVNMIAVGQPVPENPGTDPTSVVRTLGFDDSPAPAEDPPPRGWWSGPADVEGVSPYAPARSARGTRGGSTVGWNQRGAEDDSSAAAAPAPFMDSVRGTASRWLPGRQP